MEKGKGENEEEGEEVKEKADCAQIVVSLFTEPARISNYDERGCPRSGVPMKNSIWNCNREFCLSPRISIGGLATFFASNVRDLWPGHT